MVGSSFEHLGHEVDAAPSRHAHIQKQNRDLLPLQDPEGLVPRRRDGDVVPLLGEELLEGVPDRLLVVHDEDADRDISQRHRRSGEQGDLET